jgi:uncharacterized protein (DUF3820 family)
LVVAGPEPARPLDDATAEDASPAHDVSILMAAGVAVGPWRGSVIAGFCLSQLLWFARTCGPQGHGGTLDRTTTRLDFALDPNSGGNWTARAAEKSGH